MEKLKEKKSYFLLLITMFRVWIAAGIPVWALSHADTDDELLVRLAYNLMNGNWLGEYNYLTLQKGVSFSVFLAIINELHIDYNLAVVGLWILASVVFCSAMRFVLSEKSCIVLYLFLLFNPIMNCLNTVQRVYRSSVAVSFMVLLIGCYLIIYFSFLIYKKNRYLIGVCAGIVLAFFMNLRDDSIFIYPFIFAISMVIIVLAFIRKQKICKTICMLAIPFLILQGTNHFISFMNYRYYGIYLTTEPSHSAFRDFRNMLYAIEDDGESQTVSVPRSKLYKLYEYSPTLKSIEPYLEVAMDWWSTIDRIPDDNEVEDGWIRWALRDGVNRAGYYQTAVMANELYANIASELEDAVKSGKLEARNVLPVDVLPIWKNEYIPQLLETMVDAFKQVISYEEELRIYNKESTGDSIRQFESMTGEVISYPRKVYVDLEGWWALQEEGTTLKLRNINTGNDYLVEWKESPDVNAYMMQQEESDYKNSPKCRFKESIEIDEEAEVQDFVLICLDGDGKELEQIGLIQGQGIRNNMEWYIDLFEVGTKYDEYLEIAQRNTDQANKANDVWRVILRIMEVVGMAAFPVLTVLLLTGHRTVELVNNWLVSLAGLLTFIVLAIPESLLQITAFDAIDPLYLAQGYILMMLFFLLPILAVAEYYLKKYDIRR